MKSIAKQFYIPFIACIIIVMAFIGAHQYFIAPLQRHSKIYGMSTDCSEARRQKLLPTRLEQLCKIANENATKLLEEYNKVDLENLEERLKSVYP